MAPFTKNNPISRVISSTFTFVIIFSLILSPSAVYAQASFHLPLPGAMVMPTKAYMPPLIKGITIHPEDPLQFDFIIDNGQTDLDRNALKEESNKLIKYFLASLTVPKDDLWVNLSPYEKDRIIPTALGQTDLGRDLLAQDYILKQLTASLMYPEDEIGKKFWDKIYKEAYKKYGTTDIPVDTFNKVWILPESASVYENEQTVYVVKSKLKVLLEQDYLGLDQSKVTTSKSKKDAIATEIIREIIIPEIEKEVNQGENFAPLRQIYNSLILAKWYKETIKESILSKVYVDQSKMDGIDIHDPKMKEKIYGKYMEAYKKGVYNYIKDEYDPATKDVIPRKYFSGGFQNKDFDISHAMVTKDSELANGKLHNVKVKLDQQTNPDWAMLPTDNLKKEIVDLIHKLNNRGIKPMVNGTDLFMMNRSEVVPYIQHYSVLKDPADIRRVLLWKLHSLKTYNPKKKKNEHGVPLGLIDHKTADILYSSIFDNARFLSKYHNEEHLNVVVISRGKRGSELVKLLKTVPNVNVKVLLGPTDEGFLWHYAAVEFEASGVPGATNHLVDLARNLEVKNFLNARIIGDGLSNDDLGQDFNNMIHKLFDPSLNVKLSDSMNANFQHAMRMQLKDREIIRVYLKEFFDFWNEHRKNYPGTKFKFQNLPIRNLVLVGAAQKFKREKGASSNYWQDAIDSLANILMVNDGNRVVFPTKARYQIMSVREDGTIYTSEFSLNYHKNLERSPSLGLWLVDQEFANSFQEKLLDDLKIEVKPAQLSEKDVANKNFLDTVRETTLQANARQSKDIAEFIAKNAKTGDAAPAKKMTELTDEAKQILENADVMLFSSKTAPETNEGSVFIIPGAKEAIEKNNQTKNDGRGAVKLSVFEFKDEKWGKTHQILDYLQRLYRYSTGILRHKNPVLKKWDNLNHFIDYVVGGFTSPEGQDDLIESTKEVEKKTQGQINVVTIDAQRTQKEGFYCSNMLKETIIALTGIKREGYRVSDQGGLMIDKYTTVGFDSWPEAKRGLFRNKKEVKELVSYIKQNWAAIVKEGAFVFDVDLTILPKSAGALTDYTEFAYVFMRLLREDVRVAIISAGAEEEQLRRIYEAILEQMQDNRSALKYLTFYVNGGATKVGFDKLGRKRRDIKYNTQFSLGIDTLKPAIDKIFKDMAKSNFGLTDRELAIFIDKARKKYVKNNKLNFNTPWKDGGTWEPEWITAATREARQGTDEVMAFPWIEMRGEFTAEDGSKKYASLALRNTPSFTIDGKKIDIREEFQKRLKQEIGPSEVDKLYIRNGGSTTTDITNVQVSKIESFVKFITEQKLNPEMVFYFGDEFKRGGNDEEIANEKRLKNIRTIAVNPDHTEGGNPKTIWIGRTPQALEEMLEELLIHPFESRLNDEGSNKRRKTDNAMMAQKTPFTLYVKNILLKKITPFYLENNSAEEYANKLLPKAIEIINEGYSFNLIFQKEKRGPRKIGNLVWEDDDPSRPSRYDDGPGRWVRQYSDGDIIQKESIKIVQAKILSEAERAEIEKIKNEGVTEDKATNIEKNPAQKVNDVIKELKKNTSLPFTMDPNFNANAFENDNYELWANALRALHFDNDIFRRVEREKIGEERHTGVTAYATAKIDNDIHVLREYDVSLPLYYSIRTGEAARYSLFDREAMIPKEVYYMHRGVFASIEDIQKAFYKNKQRYDITVILPYLAGREYAKTVGHYHDPVEKPEVYQILSGEGLWIMQKTDETGKVIDVVTVKAKAGDIAIMLPGYGHVSINLSETEPLVLANWLTWHQTSYYGSFKENHGAAYYAIKQDNGEPALIPNPTYQEKQNLPAPRQMKAKDAIAEFGLVRGKPIYDLVKRDDFSDKVDFLNNPKKYEAVLTPKNTLAELEKENQMPVLKEDNAMISIPGTLKWDIKKLNHKNPNVRIKTMKKLGALGFKAHAALDDLLEIANNDIYETENIIKESITAIGKILSDNIAELNKYFVSAIESGNLLLVKELVKQGANVKSKGRLQKPALITAIEINDKNLVKFLLENGSDVNTEFGVQKSALYWAIKNQNIDIINILLQKKADANLKTIVKSNFPLIVAVKEKNINIVKVLLQHGADINYGYETMQSALIEAASNEDTEMTNLLLQNGAKLKPINAKEFKNLSSLELRALAFLGGTEDSNLLRYVMEELHRQFINYPINFFGNYFYDNLLPAFQITSEGYHFNLIHHKEVRGPSKLESFFTGEDPNHPIAYEDRWIHDVEVPGDIIQKETFTVVKGEKLSKEKLAKIEEIKSEGIDKDNGMIANPEGIDIAQTINFETHGINSSLEKAPGGIDLNNIDVDRQGQGIDIKFNPQGLNDVIEQNITGFTPVIINITPIQSLLPILGLDQKDEKQESQISMRESYAIEPKAKIN